MNWQTSDEEKLLKQSAEEFFREKLPVNSLRYMRDSNEASGYSKEAWKEMAELGWTGILIPEEFGGLDFGLRGLSHVLEAAGRTLSPSPLLSTVVCASTLINEIGNPAQKKAILPEIASGKRLVALAAEEGLHHGQSEVTTQAMRHGEAYRLQGQKRLVFDGAAADTFLVLARSRPNTTGKDGLSWFLVDSKAKGVHVKTFRMVDGRLGANLSLENLEVTADALLGAEAQGGASYRRVEDAGAIAVAAESLGSASAAFDMTLAYLKERKQFGVLIGSFQALQHRMAQMFVELEVSRAAVQKAADSFDKRSQDTSLLASLVKAKLSDVFHNISLEAVQLHGGIGMTDEHPIGFYLKRSRISAEVFGNSRYHRDRYAKLSDY
ncbi:MAG: acyl-CoA/acyl-ACP dehydrogenase [Proteobacteria bacterium]|nr:acyl-CoA/acyl-ACP dehydrogenase [Pseudomonadota bacterium]